MRAIVTKAFSGVLDGDVYPRDILVGEEITGDLARTAVAAGNAEGEIEIEAPQLGRVTITPLPPQPNNPPSQAAAGVAGLPPVAARFAAPSPGTEPAVPAAATVDGGASTIEGPDTPAGGKLATYHAKHRGGGSYSVMCGDDPVELAESLSRDEAEAFNALDDIGRAAFVAAHAKLPG